MVRVLAADGPAVPVGLVGEFLVGLAQLHVAAPRGRPGRHLRRGLLEVGHGQLGQFAHKTLPQVGLGKQGGQRIGGKPFVPPGEQGSVSQVKHMLPQLRRRGIEPAEPGMRQDRVDEDHRVDVHFVGNRRQQRPGPAMAGYHHGSPRTCLRHGASHPPGQLAIVGRPAFRAATQRRHEDQMPFAPQAFRRRFPGERAHEGTMHENERRALHRGQVSHGSTGGVC